MGLIKHKGYPTAHTIIALKEHGPCNYIVKVKACKDVHWH